MAITTSIYYTVNPFAPLFLINGEQMPFIVPTDWAYAPDGSKRICTANPARDYSIKTEQLVRSTRNANGQVISHPINRRLNKFDGLRWPYLSREQVTWLRKQIAKFECKLSYYDDEVDAWITRKFYWGDFSATPCEWETVKLRGTDFYFKRPTRYKDVEVNLIDMGF